MYVIFDYNVRYFPFPQNVVIQNWIKEFCSVQRESVIVVQGKHANVALLVDEVMSNPIGLGKGEFYINQSFILKVSQTIFFVRRNFNCCNIYII